MARIYRRGGGAEHRSISSGANWDALSMTGAIPPNGWQNFTNSGVPVNERSVNKLSSVNRCLDLIANYILSVGDPLACIWAYDMHTNRRYKQYVAPFPSVLSNTFGTLLDGRPRSQSEGVTATVYSMALFNEAIWVTLTRDRLGLPASVQPLHPAFVTIGSDGKGNPSYVYNSPGYGDGKPLPSEDVTHIRKGGRPGSLRGISSLTSQALGFSLALAAADFGQRFFGQGLNASYVFSSDSPIAQETVERVQAKLLIEHSGLSNAHLPLILTDGLKPQKMGISPDEAQYLGTLAYAATDIADYFGVPPMWIGVTDSKAVWGKTLEEIKQVFRDGTLTGYFRPLNEAFSTFLPDPQFASFDTKSILRGNSGDIAKEVQALRTATSITENEVRMDWLEYPPVPGGDDLHAPLASNIAPPAAEPDEPDDTLGVAA